MITTYAELLARVLATSNRPDVSAQVPEFIYLAERDIEKTLVDNWMLEASTSVAFTVATNTIDLPTDLLRLKSASIDGEVIKIIHESQRLAPGTLVYDAGPFASIIGRQMLMLSDHEASGTADLHYQKKCPSLTASATTNAILDYAPDLYLYGTLVKLFDYVMDEAKSNYYVTQYARLAVQYKTTSIYQGTEQQVDFGIGIA